MGRDKKEKRKKSSISDSEGQCHKQYKYGAVSNKGTSKEILVGTFVDSDLSVSDIISAANEVLFSDSGQSEDRKSKTFDDCSSCINISENCTPVSPVPPVLTNKNMASETLDTLLTVVTDIKTSQEKMKQMFESKLDKMRNELMGTLDNKIKNLRYEIAMEVSKESGRIDSGLTTIQSMQPQITRLEQRDQSSTADQPSDITGTTNNGSASRGVGLSSQRRYIPNHWDDSDISVTVSGVPYEDGESLINKAQDIINAQSREVSDNVLITNATRLGSRFYSRTRLIKITFQNIDEKILVLRNKRSLKDSGQLQASLYQKL